MESIEVVNVRPSRKQAMLILLRLNLLIPAGLGLTAQAFAPRTTDCV
jgi:hypothetical protein